MLTSTKKYLINQDSESMSVISKIDNTIEIQAYGFAYEKPYKKTYLIGTFAEDDKGRWYMKSVKLKDETSDTKTEENITSE